MKKEGSLKSILAILIIILLCLVSFGGIYVKDKNIMKNALPNYTLGMDLDTNTIIKLDVVNDDESSDEDTEEDLIIEDEEENDEEVALEAENTSQESTSVEQDGQAEASENIYTLDNYKKSKKIIEDRLNLAKIQQYTIRLDEQTGSIVLEVPEDVDTSILQNIFVVGKTEIKISETDEVIADHNSIKKITAAIDDSYASYGIGSFVKLDFEFTSDAVKKFKELQANQVIQTEEAQTEENQTENEQTEENETEETESENGETTETEYNIEISIDGSAIYSANESDFLETVVNGTLPLKLGDYTTDKDALNETLAEANSIKTIIESGYLPITYTVQYTNDIHSNISEIGIISVFVAILGVMLIYLMFKYKSKGILSEFSILGFGAVLLLAIRYTKVQISIASIVSIAGMLIVQFIYLIRLLNNKNLNSKVFTDGTIEFTKILIPAFIMSLIIAFANILEISGFGTVIFWGIILFEIFNNIITRAVLTNGKNK